MRIILYTGKGGVGKTSVAAATAVKSAKQGLKTLVVSTDPAHSLGDSLDIKLGHEPKEIMNNLWAQEIDPTYEMEKGWGKIQKYFTTLFTAKTVKDITTEELTIFPGMDDLISLIKLLDYYKNNTYDVVIIDSAPTGETLKLLSFPDMLRWWMEKLFPIKRKAMKVLRPVAEPLIGLPMPTDDVMGEFEQVYQQLDQMRKLFTNRDITSIRIVVNPEKMVIKEAQRSFTYLNMYDFNVDGIIINRVLPDDVTDNYFSGWKDIQRKYKEMIEESFSPVPILQAPWFGQEVVGLEMLSKMARSVFGQRDAVAINYNHRTQRFEKVEGGYHLHIYMPFMDKKDLALNQKGDEIIVKAGSIKRTISLPRTLVNGAVKGAKFEGDNLIINIGAEEHD